MTKKKRSRHRIPVEQLLRSDEITPEYQAEIDRSMARGQLAYDQAQTRLAAAERRLAKAKRVKSHTRQSKKHLQDLVILVELRREELAHLHRMMTASGGASTAHQGTGGHRHVATGELPL